MSKSKRQFHNLDGLLRDLLAAVDDDAQGWERLTAMCRIIADVIDVLDDDDSGLPDPEGTPGGSGDHQLDLPNLGDSEPLDGAHAGHDSLRVPLQREVRGLGAPLVSVQDGQALARHLARAALEAGIAAGVPGRADAVVATTGPAHNVIRGHGRHGG